MHTVVETPSYLAAAKAAGMTDETRGEIVRMVSENPTAGNLIQGTHGLRKVGHAKPGRGNSSGYRVITFYSSSDFPVFLITVFGKNQEADLTKGEAVTLGAMVKAMATNYRKKTR